MTCCRFACFFRFLTWWFSDTVVGKLVGAATLCKLSTTTLRWWTQSWVSRLDVGALKVQSWWLFREAANPWNRKRWLATKSLRCDRFEVLSTSQLLVVRKCILLRDSTLLKVNLLFLHHMHYRWALWSWCSRRLILHTKSCRNVFRRSSCHNSPRQTLRWH